MTLVRKRKGQVVCKMRLVYHGQSTWEIAWLWTDPDYRQQGLAQELMDIAKSRFMHLVGYVLPDGKGMNHLQMKRWLARNGFKPVKYQFPSWKYGKLPAMKWSAV